MLENSAKHSRVRTYTHKREHTRKMYKSSDAGFSAPRVFLRGSQLWRSLYIMSKQRPSLHAQHKAAIFYAFESVRALSPNAIVLCRGDIAA